MKDEINDIWNQSGRVRKRRKRRRNAWSTHENFTTWFGTSRRHILIRRVRRRIHKIHRWLDSARIVVIAEGARDRLYRETNTIAFATVPRRPLKVHLCQPWFSLNDSRRAAVIIHELVHELGFRHPEGATSAVAALALARRNSRKARRSPKNYKSLYELYF
ncbi:MAG: hypothetical protein GXP14_05460 [Gammaproteobacteria bacterium]|nr:hypothetical protein [Gammaproteobacteria bacterium]